MSSCIQFYGSAVWEPNPSTPLTFNRVVPCLNHCGGPIIPIIIPYLVSGDQKNACVQIFNRLESLDKAFTNLLKYSNSLIKNITEYIEISSKKIQEHKHDLLNLLQLIKKKVPDEEISKFQLDTDEKPCLFPLGEEIPISLKTSTLEYFDGELVNGVKEGKGIYYYLNGNIYNGDWRNDQENGGGIMKYLNGHVYDGNWENGKACGKGMMKYADGSIYDGEWSQGDFYGRGIYYFACGDVYDGEWLFNKAHGRGVYYYENGEEYRGEWRNDKKEGKGTFVYKNGTVYQGEWKDGGVYEGKWINGKNEEEAGISFGVVNTKEPKSQGPSKANKISPNNAKGKIGKSSSRAYIKPTSISLTSDKAKKR